MWLCFVIDINECGVSDQCDSEYGICTNTEPGYTCSCPDGFILGSDQRSCIGKFEFQFNFLCYITFYCNEQTIVGGCLKLVNLNNESG